MNHALGAGLMTAPVDLHLFTMPLLFPYYVHIIKITPRKRQNKLTEMNGVLGRNSTLVRLYWAGDNQGE